MIEPPPVPTGARLGRRGPGGLLEADLALRFCDSTTNTPAQASRPPLAPRNKSKLNSKELEEPEQCRQKRRGSSTARRSSSRRIDAGLTDAGGGRVAATSFSPRRHSSKGNASSSITDSHGPMTDTLQRSNSRPSRLRRAESTGHSLSTDYGVASTAAQSHPAVFRISSASPSPGARSKQGSRESSLVNKFRALSASEFHALDAMEDPLTPGTQHNAARSSSSHSACLRIDEDEGNHMSAMAQDLGSGNRPAQFAAGLTPRRSSSRRQKTLAAPPTVPVGMGAVKLQKAPAVLPAIRPTGAFKVASVGSIAWRLDMDRAATGSWEPRPLAAQF